MVFANKSKKRQTWKHGTIIRISHLVLRHCVFSVVENLCETSHTSLHLLREVQQVSVHSFTLCYPTMASSSELLHSVPLRLSALWYVVRSPKAEFLRTTARPLGPSVLSALFNLRLIRFHTNPYDLYVRVF